MPTRVRRKEDRPGEIIEAAIEVFAEKGFGAAKIEEIALKAGVSKGTVFVYFETKEDLFRAMARSILSIQLGRLEHVAPVADVSLADLLPRMLMLAAGVGESRVAAVLRLLIAESQAFPDLPKVWHDEVVAKALGILTSAIEAAQRRGEIRKADPRLLALSIIGPMMAGVIFRQVFAATETWLPDLRKLASQHAEILLHGILSNGSEVQPKLRRSRQSASTNIKLAAQKR